MRPRAYDAADILTECGQILGQPQDGVTVWVIPAAHRHDRGVKRAVVFAHRAVFPVVVTDLVPNPRVNERLDVLKPVLPLIEPFLAPHPLINRAGLEREHRSGPRVHIDPEHRAAEIMHVVVVAVIS